MATETSLGVNSVLDFLGKTPTTGAPTSTVLPTSKTRSMLNLLSGNTVETLLEKQVNLRTVAEGLFNWSGKNRASKNVIRALNEALNTPGKYHQAVELCGYLAAWSPLMEPDRIARMFKLVDKTDTAFAPAKYTLQLHQKLTKVFKGFNAERQEKLASSLWLQAHTGRWWDLTAGQGFEIPAANNEGTVNVREITKLFVAGDLPFSARIAPVLPKVRKTESVREMVADYTLQLDKGKVVDPDIALISSYFPWLEISERPESPIGSLVDTLITVVEQTEWKFPEKPQKFSDLFPNVRFYGADGFPFADNVYLTDGYSSNEIQFELVKTAASLAENRTYMGNCTWSYKNRMEAGTYVLYRLHYKGHIYNASMVTNNRKGFSVSEVNSRHNRGNVPQAVRDLFNTFVRNMVFDEKVTGERVRLVQEANGTKKREYKFQV